MSVRNSRVSCDVEAALLRGGWAWQVAAEEAANPGALGMDPPGTLCCSSSSDCEWGNGRGKNRVCVDSAEVRRIPRPGWGEAVPVVCHKNKQLVKEQ